MKNQSDKQKTLELMRELFRKEDVRILCKVLFRADITKKQEEMVRSIAFPNNPRVVISCMTRYGKSYCVSMGVLLFILFNENKRILLLAPAMAQTNIIRNYISEFIILSEIFRELVDIALTGLDKLKSEVSKSRITFRNGNSLQVLSAEGTAERLMGFGGDLIILDESCLIKFEVYRSKISRMLGDNKGAILIEIGNPWHRNNQMYEHWINPKYKKIHIGWEEAIEDGRLDKVFLEEQRELLTPLEFEVLYAAEFPDTSEDAIFNYKHVQRAIYDELPKKKPKNIKRIISCDVADKGKDLTVIMYGYEYDGIYVVTEIYNEPVSENMKIAGKIIQWFNEKGADYINIDCIGVGVGVVSRVREVLRVEKVTIRACHYGEGVGTAGSETQPVKGESIAERKSDSNKKRYLNRKSEQYFRLRELFIDGNIFIPDNEILSRELMKMSWELTSGGKIRIIDPEEKSPDFADALVYFTWKTSNEIHFSFGKNRGEA